jgi:AraC family transcriptional regulator
LRGGSGYHEKKGGTFRRGFVRKEVEPKIVKRERITLVGLSFFGDPFREKGGWTEENEIGRLWRRFMSYLEDDRLQMPGSRDVQACYEVHILHPETRETGEYEIFTGFETEDTSCTPPEFLLKVLPASSYAVFTFRGEEITSDWHQMIYRSWMPKSGYREAYQYSLQLYDERFKGLDRLEESTIDLYVPVEPEVNG